MNENPYAAPRRSEQQSIEQTVLVDPATGLHIPIGMRIDRVLIDPAGAQQHIVTNIVTATPDGQQLLFPYEQPLYACNECGARPLLHAVRCALCGRYVCLACAVTDETGVVRCGTCAFEPWFVRFVKWLLKL